MKWNFGLSEILDALHNEGVKYISTRSIGYEHIDIKYAHSIGMRAAHIVQNGSEQEAVMKQQIEYYQAVQQQFMNANTGSGDFYRGTLRSGQVIESESSVTIIGDVNPGAKIISQGNIVILGALKGNAHAGSAGDRNCFIFALDMNPIQIQIGDLIAKSPDKEKTRKHLLRREKVQTAESQIAVARDGNIYIEPVTKDILNRM